MKRWPDWAWERRKDDLREELEAHLRLAIEDRSARGEEPSAARAAAQRELGNLPLVTEVTRQQWGWLWCERLVLDLRYSLRQLRKSPGYTATAILTLTLAIGANTAIFSLLYALLLRSMPVEHPERIVQIKLQIGTDGGASHQPSDMVSGGIYDALAGQQRVFSGICAWSSWSMNLRDSEGTRPVPSALITGGCFQMLGVHAALGRLLTDADDRPGGGPEGYPVVLGYDYWRTHLGADPGVIGRVLNISTGFDPRDKKGVVIGVLEPGFTSTRVEDRPWLYAPSELAGGGHEFGSFDRTLLARLNDGVAPATAQAQIDPVFNARLKAEHFRYYIPDGGVLRTTDQAHLLVFPGRTGYSYLRSEYAESLYLIEGMVGLSLLVACAYLAMLASTRALARRRELAMRIALGASRMRVAAQLCCESVLLALAGSALGLLFAWAAERALLLLIATSDGSDLSALAFAPGAAVLLFTLALSAFTVVLSGAWPAWRASRLDPLIDIKEGEQSLMGRRRGWLGTWLAPVQIAFSLVIVVMAMLMASTLARLLAVDPGFRTSGVTFLNIDFSHRVQHDRVPATLGIALLDRIRHTPGVEAASISHAHQLGGAWYASTVSSTLPSGTERIDEMLTNLSVAPGYFETLGIPVLAGRDFTVNDRGEAQKVCILNRSAAEYFFPGRDAIGGKLTRPTAKKEPLEVIAVVGDTLYGDLRESPPRMIYLPYLAGDMWNPFAQVVVRSANASAGIAAVRQAFRELAQEVPVDKPITMTELVGAAVARERLVAVLSSFFAALTLVLTGIGLYGLLNFAVVRRRSEIGIRMAFGASRAAVVRMVLHEAMRLVLPGLLLGAAGAWCATRLLRDLLFGVKPLDPWSCGASLVLLIAVAAASCLLPAQRAASVDPMQALRSE